MFKGENMGNLAIITLITACVTIYYKVIKSIADSIIYFFPFKSDYYRLKDDLTEEREKDLKAFTFSIIIIFFASVIPYLWYKEKETFDVNSFLKTLVALIVLSMIYVFIVLYHKSKKIMSIEIRSGYSYCRSDKNKIKLLFKRKTFYLHSKIDKDTYLFKDSTQGNYNKLTTLSKKDMLNAFSGYVEVKPRVLKTKISKERKFELSQYIELAIAIAGIILAFIPDNNYLKIIAILGAIIIVAVIRIYKLENENKKIKEEKHKKLDSNLLKEIKEILYESKIIERMRTHDFGDSFYKNFTDPLIAYRRKLDNDPEFEFLDSDLNDLKKELDYNIIELVNTINSNTVIGEFNSKLRAVPKEWIEKKPELFKEVVNKTNHHATTVVKIYNELVQVARKKMIDL